MLWRSLRSASAALLLVLITWIPSPQTLFAAGAVHQQEHEFECVLFGGVPADLGEIGSIIAVVHGISTDGSSSVDDTKSCETQCRNLAGCIGFSYTAAVFDQCTQKTVTRAQLNLTSLGPTPPPPPPATTLPPPAPCSVGGFDGPLQGVRATLSAALAINDNVGPTPESCAELCYGDHRCRAFSYRAAGKIVFQHSFPPLHFTRLSVGYFLPPPCFWVSSLSRLSCIIICPLRPHIAEDSPFTVLVLSCFVCVSALSAHVYNEPASLPTLSHHTFLPQFALYNLSFNVRSCSSVTLAC